MGRTKMNILADVWRFRNLIIVTLTPVLLLPLPLLVDGQEAQCGYLLLLMATFWVSEALPLAITSFIPIFLLPMFGIMSTVSVAQSFVSGPTMLFIGANVIALAIEKVNLHRRFAFKILLTLGVRPKRLMLGFMLTSWFLSMWMCNTATTSMLLPVLESVLRQIEDTDDIHDSAEETTNDLLELQAPHKTCCGNGAKSINFYKMEDTNGLPDVNKTNGVHSYKPVLTIDVAQPEITAVTSPNGHSQGCDIGYTRKDPKAFHNLAVGLTLTICYAANIGGVATINGAIPNMIMKGTADALWKKNTGETSPVNFISWAQFGIPVAVINLIFLWLWMNSFYLGFKSTFGCFAANDVDTEQDQKIKTYLRREQRKLGPVSMDQLLVAFLLFMMVTLWVFREPGFMPGWAHLFPKRYMVDATPAILIALLLFVIPSNLTGSSGKGGTVPTLMDWNTMHQRFPWAVVLLMGGGFTLAKACMKSGLSKWLGSNLSAFDRLPHWLMLLIILLIVSLLTEVTSNPATCSLFMPIVAPLAIKLGMNPLYLMLPVCFATSFAFMLPAASPPNAIVFCYGHLKTMDMITAGAILNVICVLTVTIATQTWGMVLFDLGTPPWNGTLHGMGAT